MSKLTSDDLIKKYTEEKKVFSDDDSAIEFMEDISDSMVSDKSKDEEINQLKAEKEQLSKQVDEIKSKYRDRFLSADEMKFQREIMDQREEAPVEKNIIDIKEI